MKDWAGECCCCWAYFAATKRCWKHSVESWKASEIMDQKSHRYSAENRDLYEDFDKIKLGKLLSYWNSDIVEVEPKILWMFCFDLHFLRLFNSVCEFSTTLDGKWDFAKMLLSKVGNDLTFISFHKMCTLINAYLIIFKLWTACSKLSRNVIVANQTSNQNP